MIMQRARYISGAVLGNIMHERANRRDFTRMAQIDFRPFKAVWIFIGDKGGGDVPAFKPVMIIDRLEERDVMPNAVELKCVQRVFHRVNRKTAVFAPCAKLGDHRIVIHRDFAALKNARIISDNRPV